MIKGKIVNINLELLRFFYPKYKVVYDLKSIKRGDKVIYNGEIKAGLKRELSNYTNEFISLVGKVDIDLEDNEEFLKFVFNKYNKKITKSIKNQVDVLSREEIEYAGKVYWITGNWIYSELSENYIFFELFKSLNDSVRNMVDIYFSLYENYPDYVVESSLLTFFQRLSCVEEQMVSPYYKKVLKRFKKKSGNKIKKSLMKYISNSQLNDKYRILMLLINLM